MALLKLCQEGPGVTRELFSCPGKFQRLAVRVGVSVMIRGLLYAKRNDLQGKDGSTSVLRNLTNGSAWTDSEDDVSRMGVSSPKGESMTMAAEVGAEDTSSDGY